MNFIEVPHQQRFVISAGTVVQPKGKPAPGIILHLAGERGRIAGTGTFTAGKAPARDFIVNGSIHMIDEQIIISLRAYEWDTLIGSICMVFENKKVKGGLADYKIKFDEIWKVENAKVKIDILPALF